MNYKTIKINKASSFLSSYNLKPGQKVLFDENLILNNNSNYINLQNRLLIQNYKITKWNYSNFYLGNLEVNSKNHICFFLDVGSKVITILNPKNCKLKISNNKILEIVLFSKSNQKFSFSSYGFYKNYNIFDNYKIKTIEETKGFFLHHIWILINQTGRYFFKFTNDKNDYSFDLSSYKSNQNYELYTRKIIMNLKS